MRSLLSHNAKLPGSLVSRHGVLPPLQRFSCPSARQPTKGLSAPRALDSKERRLGGGELRSKNEAKKPDDGGLPPDNGDGDQPEFADLVGSAFVKAGVNGSVAVFGAALAHINLFQQFHPTSESLLQAVLLVSPLALMDICLLGIPWEGLAAVAREAEESSSGDVASGASSGKADDNDGGTADSILHRVRGLLLGLWLYQAFVLSTSALDHSLKSSNTEALTNRGAPDLPSQFALVGFREVAKELLQRGLLFTLTAGWLRDRFDQASLYDGVWLLPTLHLSNAEVGRYCAAALQVALLVPSAMSVARSAQVTVGGLLAMCNVAEVEVDDEGSNKDEPDTALLKEWRVIQEVELSIDLFPAHLAGWVTGIRIVARSLALNVAFCLSGDLAATLTASMLLDGLMLGLKNRQQGDRRAPEGR